MTTVDADRDDPAASRPYYRLLGFRVEAGQEPGCSRLVLESRPELGNSRGDVHGGVVASLLDAAMGIALRSALRAGEGIATVSLTVNYLEPGQGTLIAAGRVVRAGRTVASTEAEVADAAGRKVAHAVGTMRVIAKRG